MPIEVIAMLSESPMTYISQKDYENRMGKRRNLLFTVILSLVVLTAIAFSALKTYLNMPYPNFFQPGRASRATNHAVKIEIGNSNH